jgi:hypothetical protein
MNGTGSGLEKKARQRANAAGGPEGADVCAAGAETHRGRARVLALRAAVMGRPVQGPEPNPHETAAYRVEA